MSIKSWHNLEPVPHQNWTCGYCGHLVAGDLGYYRHPSQAAGRLTPSEMTQALRILICPGCARPTFFEGDKQVPGVAYGKPVQHLPPDLDELYTETRNCMAVGAFIPAILAARTMLMHVAVEQGAREGESFVFYVDFLVAGGFTPPNARRWVDHVRQQGNAATHRIALMSRDDAEKVLRFVEMILLFLYEYPHLP